MKKLFILFFLLTNLKLISQQYTISGYVEDEQTGEKLSNAYVYESQTFKGTSANIYGFYSLTLSGGKIALTSSFVGYGQFQKEFILKRDTVILIALQPSAQIGEVVVVDKAVNQVNSTQMGINFVDVKTVKALPVILGEVDILKTIQLLPGVKAGTEGTSGFYVRGGGPDQNLILLDGVPVYNANHLFGFFSVFNSDAIQSISLIKGGFPAHYGGRLSSVLDIRMKEGDMKKIKGEGSIGLIASRLTIEGPIKKDTSSFIISARRTYIDLLSYPIQKKNDNPDHKTRMGYYFYDINAKINYKFSDNNRVYLSLYTGTDKAYANDKQSYTRDYELEPYQKTETDFSLRWGNITTALRWNHVFNPRLFGNTTLTYSRYRFIVSGLDNSEEFTPVPSSQHSFFEYSSGINDVAVNADFDYIPAHQHFVKFGTNIIYHTFNPGVATALSKSENDPMEVDTTIGNSFIYAAEFSAYLEDDYDITPGLKLNAGLHFSGIHVKEKTYFSLQPRLALRYAILPNWSVKASYTHMKQYIHLLTNSSIGLPTDLWLPVTQKVKPQFAVQYAVGSVYNFRNMLDFSVEAYYKTMSNLIEYKEGASFFSESNDWEDKIETDGKGTCYGAEFLIEKKKGKTTGWLGYTLSWTNRQFANISFGKEFPYRYDRRHDFSLVITHTFSDRFDMGLTWVYSTGNAVTLPYEEYITNFNFDYNTYSSKVTSFDKRNNFRMPSYHRLDIGFNFRKQKKWGTRVWSIGVYNAYNRQNPFYVEITSEFDNISMQSIPKLRQISLFPIIPSISYSFQF
jgi:outer membrane receptor for ferrienterochelin and colicin